MALNKPDKIEVIKVATQVNKPIKFDQGSVYVDGTRCTDKRQAIDRLNRP